jgi:hypothetical protein
MRRKEGIELSQLSTLLYSLAWFDGGRGKSEGNPTKMQNLIYRLIGRLYEQEDSCLRLRQTLGINKATGCRGKRAFTASASAVATV